MANPNLSRGRTWLYALTGIEGTPVQTDRGRAIVSVIHADAVVAEDLARFIVVVSDPANRHPRAQHGEVGLDEGWALAKLVRETMHSAPGRPIIAVVDVPGQAYGRHEEERGIHQACAAAVDAYAEARLAGHPVVAFLAGKAMSGGFLAHGYQANRLIALDDPGVVVHAMSRAAAARVTCRSVAELAELGSKFPPMAYDIRSFAELGLIHQLIEVADADAPTAADVARVRTALADAIKDIRAAGRDLICRLESMQARKMRRASLEVRRRLAEQW